MLLYRKSDHNTNYLSIRKDFPSLYHDTIKIVNCQRRSMSVAYGHKENSVFTQFDPIINTMDIVLPAKYIKLYRSGRSILYMKVIRASFHFSAKTSMPVRDNFIRLKRMFVKLGSLRVKEYKCLATQVDDDDYYFD